MSDVTYRLVALGMGPGAGVVGQTGLTPDLARLVPGGLDEPEVRKRHRLGIERTDWSSGGGGMLRPGGLKPIRSVLIEAEASPGEWTIGASSSDPTEETAVEDVKKRAANGLRRI